MIEDREGGKGGIEDFSSGAKFCCQSWALLSAAESGQGRGLAWPKNVFFRNGRDFGELLFRYCRISVCDTRRSVSEIFVLGRQLLEKFLDSLVEGTCPMLGDDNN